LGWDALFGKSTYIDGVLAIDKLVPSTAKHLFSNIYTRPLTKANEEKTTPQICKLLWYVFPSNMYTILSQKDRAIFQPAMMF
jgi:hypothetical protein